MSTAGNDADAGGCARETHLATWFAALVVSAKISRPAFITILTHSISLKVLNDVPRSVADLFIPVPIGQGDNLDVTPAVSEDAKERLGAEVAGRRPIGSRVVVEDNGMSIGGPDDDVVYAVGRTRLEGFWTGWLCSISCVSLGVFILSLEALLQ